MAPKLTQLAWHNDHAQEQRLSLEAAAALRSSRKNVQFTCPACGERATVHTGNVVLHGEHLPTHRVDGKRRLSPRAAQCIGLLAPAKP